MGKTLGVLLILPLYFVCICGCGGVKAVDITGTVSFDGKPIPEGDIVFVPADGKQSPDAGKIVDGKFAMKAKVGKNNIRIQAMRGGGKVDKLMGTSPGENYIPDKYNIQTTLSEDVTVNGPNAFVFDLKSK